MSSYKQFLDHIPAVKSRSLLPLQFLQANQVDPDEKVVVLEGNTFDPYRLGYDGPRTVFEGYLFILVKNKQATKKSRRLFKCTHQIKTNQTCGVTFQDMNKLFTHAIHHTKEKNYVCPHRSCRKKYA